MIETVRVFPASFIEPEGLLIQIPMQVERLHTDIRAFDGAFQQRPEVLNPVRRDVASRVLLSMIDDLVGIVVLQALLSLSLWRLRLEALL